MEPQFQQPPDFTSTPGPVPGTHLVRVLSFLDQYFVDSIPLQHYEARAVTDPFPDSSQYGSQRRNGGELEGHR